MSKRFLAAPDCPRNFNLFTDFASLPSRVLLVSRLALRNPASCHEMD